MAGIVPIGGPALDFKMPWHDSMIPIAPDYLAIERAVYECAAAGCDTIWITGNKGVTPMIRKRLGDYIIDPISLNGLKIYARLRNIPIYYVPIHPRDQDKRDNLGWSVLYGADCAFRIGCFISKWVAPTRFYCAFPHGITDEKFISSVRLPLKRTEKTIIFSHKGKTIKDGLRVSFTFSAEDYKKCRDIVKKRNIDDYFLRDQVNSKLMTLSDVFEPLDIINNSVVELPWFYDISSWEGYCKYAGSEEAKTVKKHDTVFTKQKRKMFPTEQQIRSLKDEQENGEDLQQHSEPTKRENESS